MDYEINDTLPGVARLAARETIHCSWNQTAWQWAALEGTRRFQGRGTGIDRELLPVPPGRYQFSFHYSHEGDGDSMGEEVVGYSAVFEIE